VFAELEATSPVLRIRLAPQRLGGSLALPVETEVDAKCSQARDTTKGLRKQGLRAIGSTSAVFIRAYDSNSGSPMKSKSASFRPGITTAANITARATLNRLTPKIHNPPVMSRATSSSSTCIGAIAKV